MLRAGERADTPANQRPQGCGRSVPAPVVCADPTLLSLVFALSSLGLVGAFCLLFKNKVSLCKPSCPEIHCIDQAGLEIHLPLPPEW